MPEHHPHPISSAELRARRRRVSGIARRLGFVGRVEYRHVYSNTGGGQYRRAVATDRDANPEDFSLEAILAHERGHQLLARHGRLARLVPSPLSGVTEEVLASLLGSLLVEKEEDEQNLLLKALAEATAPGMRPDRAAFFLMQLRDMLEKVI